MFYHHLANLPRNSLAGEVFQIQLENSLEGIITKCREHVNKMGDPNPTDDTKRTWSNKVKKYIVDKNRVVLLNDIRRYKKLSYEDLSKEKFERKFYFSELDLESVRLMFKIQSKVVPTVRKNFSSKYRNKSLSCQSCKNLNPSFSNPQEDTQHHLITECPTFEDIRKNKDMKNSKHLTEFFKYIIQHRIDNDEI